MSSLHLRVFGGALLTVLVACAPDHQTTAPDPATPPDLAGAAFQLTIDVPTGHVTVHAPRDASQAIGGSGESPSFSLLGSETVRLHATDCTFTSLPNNSKQKRCTFDLAIENRLQYTDLVTPTTFPRPPQGTTGLLVFPYVAAALGVPGGSAVPTTAWDNAPANFFNDLSGCVSGKTSDCYRWESFAAPLYAGQTSAARAVGFDVDKAAHSVSVYIVVAADLRDNPVQTLTLLPEGPLCGWVTDVSFGSNTVATNPTILQVASYPANFEETGARRSFCSFNFAAVPAGVTILSATLGLYVNEVLDDADLIAPLIIDHLDFGTSLEDDDFDRAPLTANIGTVPVTQKDVVRTVAVDGAVKADWTAGRPRSQFRMRFAKEGAEAPVFSSIYFRGPDNDDPPTLTIRYRNP
jgi:hypothetical protein